MSIPEVNAGETKAQAGRRPTWENFMPNRRTDERGRSFLSAKRPRDDAQLGNVDDVSLLRQGLG